MSAREATPPRPAPAGEPRAADVVVAGGPVDLAGLSRLAARLARALRPGDLVLLEGPLGSGKTAFVREVASALGVSDTVRSPSFTLANIYAGAVRVHHLDLYRLEGVSSEDALVLEEYVVDDAITFVEWPEAGASHLGRPAVTVRFAHDSAETRIVTVLVHGDAVMRRWELAA